MSSSEAPLSAVARWIDPETHLPIFPRHNVKSLERRTVAAAELFQEGYYKSITAAAKALEVVRRASGRQQLSYEADGVKITEEYNYGLPEVEFGIKLEGAGEGISEGISDGEGISS
ncbi:hypothetical protein M441DRAFT_58440 [Trichoderma asperellum CBS 433.97]|uniref:Uncharacterized protein n=1 Tax=Trichoderma asperellum (strain ATCC 204424 / CBS 433.97 / NBRC 101777) TaxID=1042311 RepID=A0A2T3Z870_TRIA4|nr:hypothetical protein M441DRAFT_58440 [Trichoderma asperellum CBS 433.97]PTB40985.1 hypothetical protein M441DRAFT_58440 [Trichoderma asperellum CBS 433.97]